MTGVHRSEAWLQAQLQRTGKQIAEGAVQAMERITEGRPPEKALTTKTPANRQGDANSERLAGGAPNANSGSPPPKRGMNGLEAAYAQHLELRKKAGEVLWWKFEGMRLRLADGAYYKPDFCVLGYRRVIGGEIPALEFHETKGHWREAARVRIKVAADLYPFRFVAVKRVAGGWTVEEFGCCEP